MSGGRPGGGALGTGGGGNFVRALLFPGFSSLSTSGARKGESRKSTLINVWLVIHSMFHLEELVNHDVDLRLAMLGS